MDVKGGTAVGVGAEDGAEEAKASSDMKATGTDEVEASWGDAMAELHELAKDLDAGTLRGEVQRLRKAWSES